MNSHDRSQGRASFTTFLINQVRSLGRVGSRHEPPVSEDPFRSPSSLSCDPLRQPPSNFEPTPLLSHVIAESLVKSSVEHSSQEIEADKSHPNLLRIEEHDKPRPRSWFSFSRSPVQVLPSRSKSLHLSKSSGSSGIGRGAISAPILTSTSNRKIAHDEGIVSDGASGINATTSAQVHKEVSSKNTGGTNFQQLRSYPERLKSFRLLGSLRETPRNKSLVTITEKQDNIDNAAGDTSHLSTIENSIARRRTETLNLCRKKINRLTGHGHIKRKGVHGDGARINNSTPQPLLFSHKADTQKTEYLSLDSDSTSDLTYDSLTRSFASAVDKLNFHSPSLSSMKSVKSKSSIFNIKNRSEKDSEGDGNKDAKDEVDRKVAANAGTKRAKIKAPKQLKPADLTTKLSMVDIDPEPVEFSAAANAYVPAQPVPKYPRGVNPLSMHTDTMGFASAPAQITDLPKPPRHSLTAEEVFEAQIVEDSDEEDAIEDAPIYSPSLGDLNQYARHPPQSTKPDGSSERQERNGGMGKLGLRKSSSGPSLFSRFNRRQKDETGALHSLDVGEKATDQSRRGHLKKTSSTYFNNLFKKREMTPISESPKREAAGTPYQRVESPPLRQLDPQVESFPERISTPPNVQKRSIPRGSITPQEIAKRRGIVGMPPAYPGDIVKEGYEED